MKMLKAHGSDESRKSFNPTFNDKRSIAVPYPGTLTEISFRKLKGRYS